MGRIPVRKAMAAALATTIVLAILQIGPSASALAPPTPWDGVNPFRCTIQDAGQGTKVPDPGADPYCVHFDKTNQNVTQLGLVTFLTKEPARVQSAFTKCFYFQEDHWRGSLIQSDQQTVIYEFIGHYFFNKATGDGGVWVTGLTIAGQTFDPRTLPGFPPQYDQYYGPGRGGLISHNAVPVDPSCAKRANTAPATIYAPPSAPRCVAATGRLTRTQLGSLRLGMAAGRVRATLGPPQSVTGKYLDYCVTPNGSLLVGTRTATPHARAVILLTTSRAYVLRGRRGAAVTVGTSPSALRKAFPKAQTVLRVGRLTIVGLGPTGPPTKRPPAGRVIVGIAHGHVTYVGTYDPRALRTKRVLARYLKSLP
jgi:hypothetical protein